MPKTFKLYDQEYQVEDLSEPARGAYESLQFAHARIEELENLYAIMLRAKNSYINGIKKEMLSRKSGLMLGEE